MTIRSRIRIWAWHARVPLMLLAVLGSISAGAYAVATRKASRPTFALRAAPRSARIAPGSSAAYRIRIRRRHLVAIISLRITGGLPSGAHAQLAPARTRGSHTTLTVSTTKRTRPGNYRLHLAAFTGRLRRTIGLSLKVRAGRSTTTTPTTTPSPVTPAAQGLPFTVSGNLTGLLPAQPRPLNLALTNPNSTALSVGSLTVSVQSVSAPHATAALPCTADDFSVTQFSGAYPLVVPASATLNLSDLGIPSSQWPQVVIIDRPSNQDGCKGAMVTLAYSGTATGG
jgi:hypothetical protein